ncbi:MAG: helix-turn-helix transcriptional regulator [Firmicutes bacterium]|nr:helix-turn-helix transcriptional regulator [Bacillota bacterium]
MIRKATYNWKQGVETVLEEKNLQRYKDIGRRIAFYRKSRGLSQEKLADLIGISKSYLSKIEAPSSEKFCSLTTLFDIADGLEVDIVELLRDEMD